MESDSSLILTIDEVAELLKIPVSSVYHLAQEGKIPAQKVGKHWRFHKQTLVDWVASGIVLTTKSAKPDITKLDFS